ncbi:MAG: MurT ligase domain-containing protein [Anaerovoracaceae bacterium]|jgi:UDP-N-acetylmuramyl tripeptide synthase
MKARVVLAVCAGKIVKGLLRMMGRGGTQLPGKIADSICPDLLRYLSADVRTIIVTGTNGKTTTSRMIEKTLQDSGIDYFENKSGANLLDGITAAFIENAASSGKPKKKFALIESDEAAFKKVGLYADPELVLVTNVFRDQLDRYGEVTHTLNNIRTGVANSPNAKIVLNADCSLTASIAEDIEDKRRITFYGVNVPIYKHRVKEQSDAPYCIHCMHEYEYEYITYGHLGKYRCPNCGYSRPDPDVSVDEVKVSDADHSEITISAGGISYDAVINLPGGYNIYNGVSCAAVAYALGLDTGTAANALSDFECGFGRMEKFRLGDAETRMILIKNPAGCNQVLNFLSNIDEESVFTVCLNDNYADGRDISWIWDADFEVLASMQDKLRYIFVSGIRADDMAMRFKYAGIDTSKIIVIKNMEKLLEEISKQTVPVYIMPTYTAMMDLRALVSKRFGYKNFWE